MKKTVAILGMLMVPALCYAGKMADFRRIVPAGTNVLQFVGAGELSRWFIRGCDIAFYTPRGTPETRVLDDIPRCLEFYYYRTIKADQFATAAWDTLSKAFSTKVLDRNRPAIDKLHGIYEDVEKGDRYRLVYLPGKGTTLYLNGKTLGTVEGSEFSKVYFSIWLGKKSLDARLRARLLGKEPK